MKNIFSLFILFILAALLVLSSCAKKLDINPRQSIADDVALTNAQGINNAINSVYAALKASSLYGRDLVVISEALGDRAFSNGKGNRFVNENQNTVNAPFGFWGAAYGALNEINLILEAIPGVTTDAATRSRWEGELGFLRALLHFDLAITYAYIPSFTVAAQDKGNVVLATKGFKTAEISINYFPTRATHAAVYGQIMSDIYKAVSQLSNSNRGAYYASKLSALALGSRVALYEGNWVRADSFATAAITLGGIGAITTTANHVSGWRTALNPESIFEVRIATLNEVPTIPNGLQGALTNLVTVGNNTTSNGGFGPLVPNLRLLTDLGISFTPAPNASTLSFGASIPAIARGNDVRNQLFEIGPNVSGRHIECTKFMGKNGAPGVDNVPVLRWAELYLNRAEARSKLSTPDIAGANSDLNFIKTRRITGFTVPANLTGTALTDEITLQRSLEFAFEGYRWFDMKRWGLPIVKTTPAVNLPNTTHRYNNQIPTAEVDGNKNMVQNFGY
ncbi:MAG: RagB/SusD family nutrient uptake outer membrane protein [Williamsia sp.]|nr:RagB/SusD family nutrient uptake outer membrane protein [Williamsia sp.]